MDIFRGCKDYVEKLNRYYLYKISVEARYECLTKAIAAARKEFVLHVAMKSKERHFHRLRASQLVNERKEYRKLLIRVKHKYQRIKTLAYGK